MLRRSLLAEVDGYREFAGPEDYELFLRCAAHGHALAKLPEVLLWWRHHPARATFNQARYGLARFREVKAPYLARTLRESGRARVALWGAGPTGRRLARALHAQGVRVGMFIDIDPAKIGRRAQGVRIDNVDVLDCERDVVVVAVGARGARELIRAELTRRGFREGETAWFAS